MPHKRWFDDWELTIAQSKDLSAPEALVLLSLPHCEELRRTSVTGRPDEVKSLANLLDKLLTQLTKTKKIEVTDGTGTDLAA